LLGSTLAGETATRVESFGESDIIRGAAPVRSRDGSRVTGVVVVDTLVEKSARLWSEEILDSFREYRQLKLNKRPFKNLYVLTLALASLVVVFSATWLGLYLARGITEPLTQLAGATRRVAEGDWDVGLPETGGDEIGALVNAFDSMTVQLRNSHQALEERRRYIENILANIDAGVVSVDSEGTVTTVNPAAISLLGLRGTDLVGSDATRLFRDAGYGQVPALLDDVHTGMAPPGTRRNLTREEESRTLQVTATTLELSSKTRAGFVLFFENVSQIVEVQRMEAWKEVARRIAHEIKNPLTPIQLSAQRLQRRLSERLTGEDAALLDDCTSTIVHEVSELKGLVNEFSRFARRPAGKMHPCDLNQVVEETLPLFRQARPDLRIDFESAAQQLPVLMNREAVKRALVNLLDNAVSAVTAAHNGDAVAASASTADIAVRTRVDAELSRVVLEVSDRGPGIPAEHRGRIFEPYFSTKQDGTGLGLAIVASIAADHHAYVRLHDNEPHGTRFVIEFPMSQAA
jgi:two-component system nitrogen regulation sensor histidine kinase NtrY